MAVRLLFFCVIDAGVSLKVHLRGFKGHSKTAHSLNNHRKHLTNNV